MSRLYSHRFDSFQYTRYNTAIPTDYSEFQGFFAAGDTGQNLLRNMQEGDQLFDQTTGLKVTLRYDKLTKLFLWYGENCTVSPFIAGGAIQANSWVRMSATETVDYVAADQDGAVGLTINAAVGQELIYVVTAGRWYADLFDQPLPVQTLVASKAALGLSFAATFDAGTTHFYNGYIVEPDVTVNARHCGIVQVMGPNRQHTA